VIAVDPSSPKSGGALLGDRLRMRSGAGDPGVFLRSLAARERLGGLAEAARASVTVLAAAFDLVIVETVGIGQSETEVAELVDTLVYVAQPAAGDVVQYMKAGVMELPDVFAVNKSDLGPAAERTAHELEAALGLSHAPPGGWTPPVVRVSARDGTNLDALEERIAAHRAHLARSGALAERRLHGRDHAVLDALARRYGSYGLAALGGAPRIRERLARERERSGFDWARALSVEVERALREGGAR
jgi:LAO/AO transport system kinase